MSLFKQQPKKEEQQPDPSQATGQQPSMPLENTQQQYFQDIQEYPVTPEAAANNFDANNAPAPNSLDDTNLYRSISNNDPISPQQVSTVSTNTPVPSNIDEWKSTEDQLNQLEDQAGNLKRVLKDQLLSSRTFYNQKLQSNTVSNGSYAADVNVDLQKIQQINDSLKRWFGTDAISGSVVLDSSRQYLILLEGLDNNSDQKRLIADLNYFLDDYSILPTMTTFSYDEELTGKWQDYISAGVVNPESEVLNIYKYFQMEGQSSPLNVKNGAIEISPHARLENDLDNNVDRIYEGDRLVMRVVKDMDNRPAQIFHYFDSKLLSLDHLDEYGNNLLTQYFDKDDSKKILRENYYRIDGTLAVTKNFQGTEPYIQVMNQFNVLVQPFNTEQDFIAWWLVNKIMDNHSAVVVPVNSPILSILLEYPEAQYQVIPYVTDFDRQADKVTQLLGVLNESSPGILVNNQQAQLKISELTKGKLNVSVVSTTE